MFYLVLTPPHNPEVDISTLSQVLAASVADTGLLVRYPVASICAQAEKEVEAAAKCEAICKTGAAAECLSVDAIFAVLETIECSSLRFSDKTIELASGEKSIEFDLQAPLLLIEQNKRTFGEEYQSFKEKERQKRDKKKKKQNAELSAMLSSANEAEQDLSVWFFSQIHDGECRRVHIPTSKINYVMLGEAMTVHSKENSTILKTLLRQKASRLTIDDSLSGISYRYPYLLNPSFLQTLTEQGYTKESFPPPMLAERLRTALWLQELKN